MTSMPQNRIDVMRDSIRCFVHGLCSLIPIVGLFFFVASVVYFRRAKGQQVDWNPAVRYLTGGLMVGILGALLSVMELGFLIIALNNSAAGN